MAASLLDRVNNQLVAATAPPRRKSSRDGAEPLSLDDWAAYFTFGGLAYPLIQTTMGGVDKERIPVTAIVAQETNSAVFSLIQARVQAFSQVAFQWTRFKGSQPGDLFGSPELAVLENPWPGGHTADMLARLEIDNCICGNGYMARPRPDRLARLRPDRVTIVLGSQTDAECPTDAPDVEVAGYFYLPRTGRGVTFMPWEVAHYCADEATEILTADGWKDFRTLGVGEEVLTLNHETGLSEWQPVLDVCVFPAKHREMISMEGGEFSSLTTPNHRWATEGRNARAKTYVRRWVTSETIGTGDRIPVAAYCADLPQEPKWTDAFVETVAWFWTEGHFNSGRGPGTKARGISIAQSFKNPANLARIRAALTALFGPAVGQIPKTGPRADQPLCWRECRDDDMHIFRLSASAADTVTAAAPGKVVTSEFIRSLTASQLDLFIKVSLLADNNGKNRLGQKSRAMAEQFAFACILAGYGVSMRPNASGMTDIRMLRKRHVYPQESKRPGSAFTVQRVSYDGHVWCPRTPNQTWLARRNGSVYFTGNSPMPDPVFQFLGMSWLTPAIREVQGDSMMNEHKFRFMENAATPNLAIQFDPAIPIEMVKAFKAQMEEEHKGAWNAYKTLYLGGGATPVPVGKDFQQLDFAVVQGHGEARLAAAAGVPASWVGFSEGLAGSSLNAGNFMAARRRFTDGTLHHLWQSVATSLEDVLHKPDRGARLWFDARIPVMREDAGDIAAIQAQQATVINTLVMQGFEPDSVIQAVADNDWSLLKHTGLTSVQLHPPGDAPLAVPGDNVSHSSNGNGSSPTSNGSNGLAGTTHGPMPGGGSL